MSDKAPAWVVPVMRLGYAARAITYATVGSLAFTAALYGGRAQGTTNALEDLRAQPWGTALLWVVAVGLFCYMIWRLIDAWMDLEDHGRAAKGLFARAGLVVTGLIHGTLGVSAARLALGSGGGGEGQAQSLTARVMAMPYGAWIVGAVGLGVLGAGVYYAWKGWSRRYRKDIHTTRITIRLDPALAAGFVAQGLTVGVVGILILYAAITTNPQQAGGIGEALQQIRSVAHGRVLLGLVALGLIAFALENAVEAIWRILPRRTGADVGTLARRAKGKAQDKAEETARRAGA